MTMPCDKCICLPTCRSRYLDKHRDDRSVLSNLRILTDMCEPLDDYFFEHKGTPSERIFKVAYFLQGKEMIE